MNMAVFCRALASFFVASSVLPTSPFVVEAGSAAATASATAMPGPNIAPARGTLRASPGSRMLQNLETTETPAPSAGLTPMPTQANPGVSPDSTCSNGFSGVESVNGKTCCALYCGMCAGVGCSNLGNSSDCCATEIASEREECSIAGKAPCFIVPEEPFVVEHTFLYFIVLFIIPFVIIACVCNNPSFFMCCCRKKFDHGGEEETTAHLEGHNINPQGVVPSPKNAPTAVPPPKQENKKAATAARKKAAGATGTCAVTAVSAASSFQTYTPGATPTSAVSVGGIVTPTSATSTRAGATPTSFAATRARTTSTSGAASVSSATRAVGTIAAADATADVSVSSVPQDVRT